MPAPVVTPSPPVKKCECYPTVDTGDRLGLCATAKPHCRCLFEHANVCPKFERCPESGPCKSSWAPDYVCADPLYNELDHAGSAGAPCSGYTTPDGAVVTGAMFCNYCGPYDGMSEIYDWNGNNGDPCTGYVQESGRKVPGKMANCR